MDWFAKAFLKTAISWLGLGVTLGLAMAMHPPWTAFRTAHLHMNLLGFISMMIFGVAYHVIPRFTGHPLHSRRLAGIHWWVANIGLALLVAGFVTISPRAGGRTILLTVGGALSAIGAYAFIYNVWRTIDGSPIPVPRASRSSPVLRRLPLSEEAR